MKKDSRTALKRAAGIMLAMIIALAMMPLNGVKSYAAEPNDYTVGDYTYTLYDGSEDETGTSIWIKKYNGNAENVIIPSFVTINGKEYGGIFVGAGAFENNSTIKKVAIPNSSNAVLSNAFHGCTSLEEIAIENEAVYLGENAFSGCPNLKTYRLNGAELERYVTDSGIGRDDSGIIYPGVSVYTKSDSSVENAIGPNNEPGTINGNSEGEKITVIIEENPYSNNTVTPDSGDGGGGDSGGNSDNPGGNSDKPAGGTDNNSGNTDNKDEAVQNGEDGTPLGRGASAEAADKALTSYSGESDPKGTVYSLLQARVSKVSKKSLTLTWKKVSGASSFVVYGNACGKKNKMIRQTASAKTKISFNKVSGKAVKKGTYYKFVIVALDKDNKVVSTSKIVHAATSGGKAGNHKSVSVKSSVIKKAKALKKGKSIKLSAKMVPQSKKLKVAKHRGVAYESSDPAVASVNGKGVVKAKKKGSCFIYAYAQNGVPKKIKVTVK